MLRILIRISDEFKFNKEYISNIQNVIAKLNEDKHFLNEIKFELETYKMDTGEASLVLNNPNLLLDTKIQELYGDSPYNSIVYIPGMFLNLKGNFLWYSHGAPKQSVMVISSFLFKHLLEGKIDFGAYVLLLYSQYLARFSVNLKFSHRDSRKCLNDFCGNQIEVLNVFKNEKNVLCDECISNLRKINYYKLINNLIKFLDRYYHDKTRRKKVTVIPKKKEPEEVEKAEEKVKIKDEKKCHWEYEIYMAKKCANMTVLYNQLKELLSDPEPPIEGYSMYEVGGGWQGDIEIPDNDNSKWGELKALKEYFRSKNINDIIRPIYNNSKKFAIYDETSIVLRMIVELDCNVSPLDESVNPAFRRIRGIFKDVTEENYLFFTVKQLYYSGDLER